MSELLKVNVNERTEKKGGLTYLSWAWAWAEALKFDPEATWVVHRYKDAGQEIPFMPIGETAMVHTSVTVKGVTRECMLPVMDNRNNAVKNPDARKISDAIMRCMTKALAMHGLGLYIYAGEDLPEGDEPVKEEKPVAKAAPAKTGSMADVIATMPALDEEWTVYYKELAANIEDTFTSSGQAAAYDRLTAEGLESEGMLYLWSFLRNSKVRSGLKIEKNLRIGVI